LAEAGHKLRRLRSLSAWQWQVMLATPFILLLTWYRLRRAGYRATLDRAQGKPASTLTAEEQLELARETAYAVAVAVKYGPWRPLCLLRSMTLAWFLGRRGIPFEVRIGLPGDAGGTLDFTAHAWVEHAGVVLNDKEGVGREYRPF
jgi:hypothetical protein